MLWLECEDTEEGSDDAVLADSGEGENGKQPGNNNKKLELGRRHSFKYSGSAVRRTLKVYIDHGTTTKAYGEE